MFKRFCLLVLMTALAAGTASAAQNREARARRHGADPAPAVPTAAAAAVREPRGCTPSVDPDLRRPVLDWVLAVPSASTSRPRRRARAGPLGRRGWRGALTPSPRAPAGHASPPKAPPAPTPSTPAKPRPRSIGYPDGWEPMGTTQNHNRQTNLITTVCGLWCSEPNPCAFN